MNVIKVVPPGEQIAAASEEFETPKTVSTRTSVRLEAPKVDGADKRSKSHAAHAWYDAAAFAMPDEALFARLVNSPYSGVVVYLDNIEALLPAIPKRMDVVLRLRHATDLELFFESKYFGKSKEWKSGRKLIVACNEKEVLRDIKGDGYSTCYECHVDDRDSLLGSIADGYSFDYLWIYFRDPTNIPLELVIASLQSTDTVLMKEVRDPGNIEDAIVSYGVMEYGTDGVIFSPQENELLTRFIRHLQEGESGLIDIQTGTVIESRPVGMGYRACIDTSTLFQPNEGMLIGSTSQGGILACPEVFFLPYMELRPFRINAGAVHSYVFNDEDRTDYMTELRAGSSIMVVDAKGKTRRATVGRMKIEQRPLRLIELEFPGGKRINVMMQDDWHVRIFSDLAKPLNISELKPGDKVLGYVTAPGRHVGIKINESIIEK